MEPTQLERIIVRRGILDQNIVSRIRRTEAIAFHEVAIRQIGSIEEEAWLEAVAVEEGFPPVWPSGSPSSLSQGHWDAQKLFEMAAVVLRIDPIPVIGMLDPAFEGEVRVAFQQMNPQGAAPEIRLISPHFFLSVREYCPTSASCEEPSFTTDEMKEWAEECGLNGVEALSDLIAALHHACMVDTLPDGFVRRAERIRGLADVWLVQGGKTIAWVATPRANNLQIAKQCLQILGKRVYVLAISPWENRRLDESTPHAVEDIEEFKAAGWQISANWNSGEIGQKLYEQIIESAAIAGASDIHIEPKDGRSRVRFRILGVMVEQSPLELIYAKDFLRRVKIQASLRHDHERTIQSGAAEFNRANGEKLELRVEVSPPKGDEESAVIRLLDRRLPDLGQLQIDAKSRRAIDWFLPQETGMMILSGPTGSGKTTTIYACLNELDRPDQKIITIEDPVEKHLSGAVQFEINERQNITFAALMKSVVRQDPDILMVQEMRDPESAQAAMDCAVSGTQVFTTTHANDCAGVITRVNSSFRIDRSTFAYAVKMIMAQRLVRRLCTCKVTEEATPDELRFFGNIYDSIERPLSAKRRGCPLCHGSGYRDRFAVAEVMIVDQALRELIERNEPPHQLRRANQARGYKTLPEIAVSLAFSGEIELMEARSFLPDLPV